MDEQSATLGRLIRREVLKESGETFEITSTFRSFCEDRTEDEKKSVDIDVGALDKLPFETDTVERYMSGLRSFGFDSTEMDLLELALIVARFDAAVAETSPLAGAAIVQPGELEAFLTTDAAICYVFRDDCPPCETVERNLETLLKKAVLPQSVVVGAVAGPKHVKALARRGVTGAPTVLFVHSGRIRVQLEGKQSVDKLAAAAADVFSRQ